MVQCMSMGARSYFSFIKNEFEILWPCKANILAHTRKVFGHISKNADAKKNIVYLHLIFCCIVKKKNSIFDVHVLKLFQFTFFFLQFIFKWKTIMLYSINIVTSKSYLALLNFIYDWFKSGTEKQDVDEKKLVWFVSLDK